MLDANRKIPDSVTEVIEDTTLERWYNKLRLRYLSDIRFEDTDISFTLLLPPGTRMKEKKSSNKEQYEPGLTAELISRISKSDIFYDVGSHFGYTSMIAREAGINPENIYAFEQDWFRAAVWKKNHQTVGARILESQVGDSTDQSIIILDEFASNHESPTILKIDVVGAELSVLRGFENILANTRPTVYCEVHTGWVQQGTVNEILNLIRDYNYSVDGKNHFLPDSDWRPVEEFIEEESTFLLRAY